MAKNLQKKLPASDTLRVFDINRAAADALVKEVGEASAGGAAVEVSGSALDAARDSVRAAQDLCVWCFLWLCAARH
ncbi:hypothetical protein IMZ48_42375 [Candidatus Bathyarchaeota archaeon]|nr:hypothetical protein [Candidatus Bathyarchaeota archaeon]